MWMLIVSALLLGFVIGFISGSVIMSWSIMRSIEGRGFIELRSKLYLIKKLDVNELKERLAQDYTEGGRVK